jgi:hypothetical protein
VGLVSVYIGLPEIVTWHRIPRMLIGRGTFTNSACSDHMCITSRVKFKRSKSQDLKISSSKVSKILRAVSSIIRRFLPTYCTETIRS